MADVKEETTTLKCGPCLFDGETVEPKHFCLDCLEYLCDCCIRDHRRNKILREHKILGECELPQDVKLFKEMKKLSYCSIHPDVELDQYCPNHDALICLYCLKNDHRLCENLTNLTCLLEEKYKTANPSELIFEVQKMCKAQHTELMSLSEASQINKNEVEHDMHNFIQTLRDSIDNIDKTLNERLESLISPLTQFIRQSEQMLSNIERKALYYEDLSAITTKYGKLKHNLVLTFMMSTLLKEFAACASVKTTTSTQINFIQLVTTKDMLSMLRQCDVVLKEEQTSELCSDEALGEDALTFSNTKTRDVATQVEANVLVYQASPNQNLHKVTITYDNIRVLNCECPHNEGQRRSVIALDILTDGRILLLHQDTIKLYSLKLTLISKFQLQNTAKDMSIICDNQDGDFAVAVCFDQLSTIKCLEHASEFREKCEITCRYNVISMSMCVHHLAVLVESKSLNSSCAIHLLDISTGHVCYAYEEFMSIIDGSRVALYKPKRICACKTTQQFILADEKTVYQFNINDNTCEEKTLYLVGSCQGEYKIWQKDQPELTNIKDVKCDTQRNVYVMSGDAVYQTKVTYSIRNLVPKCAYGSAIAIDECRNRIVIGYSNSGCAHVFEYKRPT